MTHRLLAAAAALLLGSAAGATTVYRCDEPGGTPTFQQQPCAGAGRALELSPVPPARASARAGMRRADAPREDEALARHGPPTQTTTELDAGGGVARHHVWRHADGSSRSLRIRDGLVVAVRERAAPRRRAAPPCPGALAIRAERVSASSLTLSPAERAARERRIAEMERCGREGPRERRARR